MSQKERGKFIVFEGNDGSGKTTHSKRLVDLLQKSGVRVIWTREPGGIKELSPLRSLALDERVAVDGLSQLYIFTTDRRLHLLLVVEPNLQAGTDVYCDRFDGSTIVYQHYVRGIPLETVN
ncbi:MAG: dTMP kinase, partial [bacterium]|nr:dTMP kinase [bacterium]